MVDLNGAPGYVAFVGGVPSYATAVHGRIHTIQIVNNPDKLAYLARQLSRSAAG